MDSKDSAMDSKDSKDSAMDTVVRIPVGIAILDFRFYFKFSTGI